MDDQYVVRGQDEFADAIAALLPTGLAWPRDPDSELMQVVFGLAGPWADVALAADAMLSLEGFPPTSLNMLTDWETSFGLPDTCLAEPLTVADRHTALVRRMTTQGGQSRAFFIAEAAALGYDITISEYAPFICGISQCGLTNNLCNPDDPTMPRWQLGAPEIRFYWIVHVKQLRISYFICGENECGQSLGQIALATDLECLIRRYAPGHTQVIFDYETNYELDFSQTFNSQYLPLIAAGAP